MYGEPKLIPVLLTGAKDSQYPWRQSVYKLVSEYYPFMSCPHHGYYARPGAAQLLHGEQYAKALNASLIAPVCGTVAKELVRKHFEIPGCRACLITENSPAVRAAGFVDMKNCVFADESDVLDKLHYLFQHTDELEANTNSGHQLVHARHTRKQRDQMLQWLTLHAHIKPDQRIVQPGPFAPLSLVPTTSGVRNGHLISNGLHLALLRQGHEHLLAGKYDKAEMSYLKCLSYMRRLSEAQLGLAICSLYRGNPRAGKTHKF